MHRRPLLSLLDAYAARDPEETADVDRVRRLVEALPARSTCACLSAAAHAIVTDRGTIPAETVEKLRPIYGHYLDA